MVVSKVIPMNFFKTFLYDLKLKIKCIIVSILDFYIILFFMIFLLIQ